MDIIDKRKGVTNVSALSVLLLSKGTYFFCDTHVTPDPTAEQLAEMTILAADEIRRFGITPKVGLLSHSNFGSHRSERAVKMSEAVNLIRKLAPDLEVEGEMQGDVALNEEIRDRVFPNSQLEGRANLLIMPTLGAANISFNLVKSLGEGLSVGPLLIGTAQPAHVVTPAISARGIVNISALAVVDAQSSEHEQRELL
jgi:malate dehydrogenase (oxaloacetate-decarboxylating)(NADP+)